MTETAQFTNELYGLLLVGIQEVKSSNLDQKLMKLGGLFW